MLALKAQKILIVLYHTVKRSCKWSWLNPHFWSQIAHCAFTEEEYYVSHFYWLGDTFQVIPHVCDKFSHSKIPKIAYFPAIFFVWNIFFLLWNFKKKSHKWTFILLKCRALYISESDLRSWKKNILIVAVDSKAV